MDAVEEIKTRLAIEDVASEYVQLKRAGRNFKGLSPFTSEKTPSFIVSPEKQIWHDFSSGKGGDMFSFVMEMEGLDFKGTLDLLARRAGIDLEQFRTGRSSDFGKVKERLYEANELATRFYQAQFKRSDRALEYIFKERSFNKQAVLDFSIGYSPNNGDALLKFLKSKNFTEQEIQRAGLAARRYRDSVDMFRGRIQIPLADPQGRVIGFTSRALSDDGGPKYLNTPQTALYDKGRHIYGLHLAKEAIRKKGFAVLAEGNLDVVASHQASVRQVVATAGTALTEMQFKALSRFTDDVRLAFDQDAAGLSAAERAIPIASKVGINLGIITLPEGKDPDELIKKDPKAWEDAIRQPLYALDWLMERYAAQLDLKSAPGKRRFSDIVLKVVRQLPDRVEQDHYAARIADRLGVSKEAITHKLAISRAPGTVRKRRTAAKPVNPDSLASERRKTQDRLLALMFFQPSIRQYLNQINSSMLLGEPAHQLLSLLQDNPHFTANSQISVQLSSLESYVKILGLQYEELYQGLELLELRNEAARLQVRLIEHYVKTEKQPLIEAMKTADSSEADALLQKAKKLDELLKFRR